VGFATATADADAATEPLGVFGVLHSEKRPPNDAFDCLTDNTRGDGAMAETSPSTMAGVPASATIHTKSRIRTGKQTYYVNNERSINRLYLKIRATTLCFKYNLNIDIYILDWVVRILHNSN